MGVIRTEDMSVLEEISNFFMGVNNMQYVSTLRRVLYDLFPGTYAEFGDPSVEDEIDELIAELEAEAKREKEEERARTVKVLPRKGKPLMIGLGSAGANFILREASNSLFYTNKKLIITDDAEVMARAAEVDSVLVGCGKDRARCGEDIIKIFEDEKYLIKAAFEGYSADEAIVVFGAGGNMCWALPVVKTICSEVGITSIIPAFFLPFDFEGQERIENSGKISKIIKENYQDYVELNNNKAFSVCSKHTSIIQVCSILDQMMAFNLKQICQN
ncbi:hypothetical protein [Butyrivibrio sp.]|uniref:hypothetical protein n=1 Tax=Butyrivibrio sp. TaxID=28121 RepID=UPI0025BA9A67|nr:hypothetical protein [Butyrivibrio sp.]MBE5838425.1 hypothetical protein [Butyrivibrio sp.]